MTYQEFRAIVFPNVSTKYGAPLGRTDLVRPTGAEGYIYDRKVPMCEGYDRGGAYWGLPHNLRCRFTADGLFIHYYRA